MASIILRPSSDISVGHSKYGASTGYDCINDTTSDDGSTYLYQSISSINYESKTSTFGLSADSLPDENPYISVDSFSISLRGTQDGRSNNDKYALVSVSLTNRGSNTTSTSSTQTVTTGGWVDRTYTITPSAIGLNDVYRINSIPSALSLGLITNGKRYIAGSYANFNFQISQMYVTMNYTVKGYYDCYLNLTAKENISAVKSSKTNPIIDGSSVTCTATVADHCTFRGWYSDAAGTQLVSTANPYTFNITTDTELYAFADEILYTASIGNIDSLSGATVSVSPTTGYYGDSLTFTCTVTDNKYGFYGWYTDATLKNRVSDAATYTTTYGDENIILYARIDLRGTLVTVRPSKATDPYPFRWNGNSVDLTTPTDTGPSDSLVKNYDVLKTNSVATATTCATQNYRKRDDGSPMKGAMVLQLAEGVSDIPEHAQLVSCNLTMKYSITNPDHVYEDCFVAFGLIDYIPNDAMADYDETPIQYVRGVAELDPSATMATFTEADISISRWIAQEIREGHFGMSIEYGNDGTIDTTLNVYAVELEVIYKLPEEQYFYVKAIPDENTRVQVGDRPNVEMINLVSNSYVAGNTRAVIPLTNQLTADDTNAESASVINLYSFNNNTSTTNLYNTSMDLQPMTGETETYYDLMTPYYTEAYGFLPGATYKVTGKYTLTGGNMKVRWGYSYGSVPSSWTMSQSDAFPATSTLSDFEYTFTTPDNMVGFYIRIQMYDGTTSDTLVFTDLSIVGPRFTPELLLQDLTTEHVKQGDSITVVAKSEGGYRFDGWYSDPDFTQLVSNDATYTISNVQAETTLYAKSNYYCRVVKRSLDIPFGSGATYFTGRIYNTTTGAISNGSASNGTSGFRTDLDLQSGLLLSWLNIDVQAACASTNGNFDNGGYINSAGMKILYPNSSAHPVKADWYLEPGRGSASYKAALLKRQGAPLSPYDSITCCFDFTPLATFYPSRINGVPFTMTNMHATALLNTTRSSKIEYRMKLHQSLQAFALGVNRTTLGLYFEQYDYHAKIVDGSSGIIATGSNDGSGFCSTSDILSATNQTYFNEDETSFDLLAYEGDGLMIGLYLEPDATLVDICEDEEMTRTLKEYVFTLGDITYDGRVDSDTGVKTYVYLIPPTKLYQDFTVYIKTKQDHTITIVDIAEESETNYFTFTQEPPNPVPHGENVVITATPTIEDVDVFIWFTDANTPTVYIGKSSTLDLNEYYASLGDNSAPGVTESMTIYCYPYKHNPKLWVGDQKVKYTVRRGE